MADEQLKLDQVRRELIAQHKDLREQIARLRKTASRAEKGEASLPAVRAQLDELASMLSVHQAQEELRLGPLLQDVDAWGPERVMMMPHEHQAEHAALNGAVEKARSSKNVHVICDAVTQLSRLLLTHMLEEEKYFLGKPVLNLDPVRTDLFTG